MDILQAREIRGKHVSELMELHKYKTIAILKLNVVGKNKNPINMRFICLFFKSSPINIVSTTGSGVGKKFLSKIISF